MFYCVIIQLEMKKQNKKQMKRKTLYQIFFKRFFDIVLSLLAIIVLSPIMLVIFILHKIFIGGKFLFKQYRPGKNGKVFKLYKIRSMTDAVDENGNLLPDNKRLTKFGKFIRKTSIDELPQLWNILKGDMSIVGPRPRLVKDMVFYDKDVLKAYTVRPGLTGLSQVSGGRSNASWEEIFEKDLEYANKITFWGDVSILFKTVFTFFKKDNTSSCAGESKREYYYGDYLLKTKQITQEQYDIGLKQADDIINSATSEKLKSNTDKDS